MTPLPVDVVRDWWDYLVGGVGIVSGVATAGALWVAALAYRRQVDDAFRQQATEVVISVTALDKPAQVAVHAENHSDQPVLLTSVRAFRASEYGDVHFLFNPGDSCVLFAHDKLSLYRIKGAAKPPYTTINFYDAHGRLWQRDLTLGLVRIGQKPFDQMRRRHEIQKKSRG